MTFLGPAACRFEAEPLAREEQGTFVRFASHTFLQFELLIADVLMNWFFCLHFLVFGYNFDRLIHEMNCLKVTEIPWRSSEQKLGFEDRTFINRLMFEHMLLVEVFQLVWLISTDDNHD